MNTEPTFWGYTSDEWHRVFWIFNELSAVHPDMDPKFWEGEILEMAQIVNAKDGRAVCECPIPWLPIGGWGCERCGKTVHNKEYEKYAKAKAQAIQEFDNDPTR